MMVGARVFRYQVRQIRRSRAVYGYGLMLLALTHALLQLGGGGPRALVSLINVVLLFVPLASLLIGAIHLYEARDFIELLLAQPVSRRDLFAGLWTGLAVPLGLAFVLGVGLPFLWHGGVGGGVAGPLGRLLAAGGLLTAAFSALAIWVTVRFDDRVQGLGMAIAGWVLLAVVYDGLLLLVVVLIRNRALDVQLMLLSLANPINAARVGLVVGLDAPALLGHTGAALVRAVGGTGGMALSAMALLLWTAGPLAIARRRFERKDF